MSSARSEGVKGHVTRVGDVVVRGVCYTNFLWFHCEELEFRRCANKTQSLTLRLRTLPPLNLSISPTSPLPLPPLSHLRTLLNQSLDCISITQWTGDRSSAPFISSQLRLLHSIIKEALAVLNPAGELEAPDPSEGTVIRTGRGGGGGGNGLEWAHTPLPPSTFSPPLPSNLSLSLTPLSSSLLLTLRVLEPIAATQALGSRFAHVLGVQRRLEHDEMEGVYMYGGEEVRVKEKVVLESSCDPGMLTLGVKLGALERVVGGVRGGLGVVMGEGVED